MKQVGCEIVTGARLHFGLLDTTRPFGGAGMMITNPHTRISMTRTPGMPFRVEGPGQDRAFEVAKRYCEVAGLSELPQLFLQIQDRPLAHSGLGSGTQLDMAVAEGLQVTLGNDVPRQVLQQRIAARGQRSAVGVYGYWLGGLIYDGEPSAVGNTGEVPELVLNAMRARVELPDHWRIALLWPKDFRLPEIAGEVEQSHFQTLLRPSQEDRDGLSQLLENSLLTAAEDGQFEPFCDAVREYNYRAGMFFSQVQGGAYNGQAIADCIASLGERGFKGTGQTSWGPTVFVFCEETAEVETLRNILPEGWAIGAVAKPLNNGRELRMID